MKIIKKVITEITYGCRCIKKQTVVKMFRQHVEK